VTVAIQAGYDEYLRRQVDHYEAYVTGRVDAIGHDMEVAEAPTRVIGNAEAAVAIGLRVGKTPTEEAIARVGSGRHAVTGEAFTRPHLGQNGGRVAYHDLVFSVPKSVSVEFAAARAAGDERRAQQLIGAMTRSVEEALGHFQDLVPLGRRRVGKEGSQIAVPAKVVALIDVHSAARPVAGQTSGDPQLHVHTRLLNLGLQPRDAERPAQPPPVGSIHYWMLYQHVRALNGLFEAGLRTRLESLGYRTASTEHGDRRPWPSFELERQDESLSARLSSRQARVEALVAKEWEGRQNGLLAALQIASALRNAVGIPAEPVTALSPRQRSLVKPTPKQAAALSRVSREEKLAKTRAELAEEWGRAVAEHGYRHQPSDPPLRSCRRSRRAREREMARISRAALASGGLVAGRSVFDRGDILEFVSSRAVAGRLDAAELRRVVERVEVMAVRLEATPPEPLGAFTTREQLRREREAVEVAVAMADEPTVSVSQALVSQAIAGERGSAGHALDAEQEAAVRAFCSPSGWVQLVGVAGAGKTSVCRPAVAALEEAGYSVLGVSLSQGATDILGAETGIPSWNLADFLVRVENGVLRTRDGEAVSIGPRTVILVDEAGTVDSRTWHAFTRLCVAAGVAGIRILGDPEQVQPVGSGSILGWLSRHLPTNCLTANYRQGDASVEAEAARLLREGKGVEFLRLKDRLGQLWIDTDRATSVGRGAEAWVEAIAGGGDPKQHVLLSDLVEVVGELNARARAGYDRLGRLGEVRVTVRGREWAVGDRVMFTAPHSQRVPVLDDAGRVVLRVDGTPRERTVRTPRRTQGVLEAFHAGPEGDLVLQVRTDGRGRLPERVVHVPAGMDVLDHGYAMTTTVAQGRSWDTTYRVLTASRLTGRQQEYPAATRHVARSLLFGDLGSVFAEADGEIGAREDAILKYGALISRDVSKVSTLDYLSTEDRRVLEERLAPRYMRTAAYTAKAPMSERQASYLVALKREPGWGWSWVRASVEIDLALHRPAGQMALDWMEGQGISRPAAWNAVDAACREAGVKNPMPRPESEAPSVAPDWDTAATLDAARRERIAVLRQRAGATAGVSARAVSDAPAVTVTTSADERSGEEGLAHIREVLCRIQERLSQSSPEAMRRHGDGTDLDGVDAPEPMDEEEQDHEEQVAREAAEAWAERERPPRAYDW
jgi:conjugative relaxase-like TrwC/TraI family protein